MEILVGNGKIVLAQGDITEQKVEVIVTAANAGLEGGGGVDGAVHRAAGPKLLEACQEIGGCAPGSAVRTAAFDLEERGVKFVIHAVGPRWQGGTADERDLLRSAYAKSLELAQKVDCTSIAFPAISTGLFGYPVEKAAPIAVRAVADFLMESSKSLTDITFTLYDADTFRRFKQGLILELSLTDPA